MKAFLTTTIAVIASAIFFLQSHGLIQKNITPESIISMVSDIKSIDLLAKNSNTTVNFTELNKYFSFEITNLNDMCEYILERDAYMSCYSGKYKIPFLVAYKLEKAKVLKKMKRPSSFQNDKSVPIKKQALNSNYSRTGYDRGHMMENASADWSKKAQIETFLFTNIVPQKDVFNRGAWAKLEAYTRELSYKYRDVYIITGAIPGSKTIRNGVNIPKKMYKIIYIPKTNKTEVYLYPNDSTVKRSQFLNKKYHSSIREIESLTGFKFK